MNKKEKIVDVLMLIILIWASWMFLTQDVDIVLLSI